MAFYWWVLTGSNRRHSPCKGDALPAELSTLNAEKLLVYSILERFSSPEFRRICSLDLDGSAGAWITAATSSALANVESTKTNQCYEVTFFKGFSNCSSRCIQSTASGSLRDFSFLGDLINQFRFVHEQSPFDIIRDK
jgi:hypothetical protein